MIRTLKLLTALIPVLLVLPTAHAARATGLAGAFGQDYLLALVSRKTVLNLGIVTSAAAQKAFLVFVPFAALWFYSVRGQVNSMLAADKRAMAALKGIVIGAIGAFLLNDSGLVFGGIMLSMVAVFLLYSLSETRDA